MLNIIHTLSEQFHTTANDSQQLVDVSIRFCQNMAIKTITNVI